MCVINPNYLPIFDVGNNGNFWLKKRTFTMGTFVPYFLRLPDYSVSVGSF